VPIPRVPTGWGQTKPPDGVPVDWGHPLSRGLVACWLFNQGAGRLAPNLAGGRGNTDGFFTTFGADGPQWIGSPYGSAVYFSGDGDNVEFGDVAWGLGSAFSVRLILRIDNTNYTSFWRDDGTLNIQPNGGNMRFVTWPGGTVRFTDSTGGAVVNGEWADWVFAWNGTGRIYKNGVEVAYSAQDAGTGANADGTDTFRLGCSGGGGEAATGALALAQLWRREILRDEAAALAAAPFDMIWRPRWFIPAAAAAQGTPELYGRPFGQHGQAQMHQLLAQ
jgi:hypothetical protein